MRQATGFVCACAALVAAGIFLPAWAQTRSAAEIALVEGATAQAYTVLGEVSAEVHQKAIFAKTSARDVANQELREKAARLGADAVVDVRYDSYSPLFSKKGFRAAGKAVKFTGAPVQLAAAPAPAASPQPASSVPAAAPARAAAPRAAEGVLLSEQDLAGRAYTVVGSLTAEAHQSSLFPRKSARQTLEEDLRAQAAKLGADAVILVEYEESSPLFSRKGSRASGKAVKFTTAPAQLAAAPASAAAPVAEPAAPALPQAIPPAPLRAAPVTAPAVSPGPDTTIPATVPAPAAAATAPAMVLLTEQDLAGRAYAVLGAVTAEAHQTSLFPKKTARETLDEDLRAQAGKLGADAIILIRYEENSPLLSRKGSRASGVAVKFR